MKVRAWLLSQGAEGVGSRGRIHRSAWALVAQAAEDGMTFDDYDPSAPGKVTKPDTSDLPAAYRTPEPIRPTYRVKSLPVVRKAKTAYSYLNGMARPTVLAFDLCASCKNHVSRCPCTKGPSAPAYTTGEVLFQRPKV